MRPRRQRPPQQLRRLVDAGVVRPARRHVDGVVAARPEEADDRQPAGAASDRELCAAPPPRQGARHHLKRLLLLLPEGAVGAQGREEGRGSPGEGRALEALCERAAGAGAKVGAVQGVGRGWLLWRRWRWRRLQGLNAAPRARLGAAESQRLPRPPARLHLLLVLLLLLLVGLLSSARRCCWSLAAAAAAVSLPAGARHGDAAAAAAAAASDRRRRRRRRRRGRRRRRYSGPSVHAYHVGSIHSYSWLVSSSRAPVRPGLSNSSTTSRR